MTNTNAPELTNQQIIDSIFHYAPNGTWAPGIAFPAGTASPPPKNDTCHNTDFYWSIGSGSLWQYQGGDYPSGDWHNLETSLNEIACGNILDSPANERDLFNKWDEGTVYQWITVNGTGAWRNIGPNTGGLPLGADAITFTDSSKTFRSARLGMILNHDTGSSPLLATDVGFIVKKDISAGGFIGANQGELWLGHGRANATDIPKIVLMHSGDGYDTLYLKQSGGSTSAHLDLGNLTVHGQLNVDSSGSSSGNLVVNGTLIVATDGIYFNDVVKGYTGQLTCATDFNVNHAGPVFSNINSSNSTVAFSLQRNSDTKMTLGYDGNNFIETYHDHLSISTNESGKDIVIYPAGVLRLSGGRHLVPETSNTGMVGSHGDGLAFYEVAGYYVYGHIAGYFDAYDDLALVKQWGEKNPTVPENYDSSKVKPPKTDDPFSILRGTDQQGNADNTEFYDFGKTHGFALGCAKALALKADEQDAKFAEALKEIEDLKAELKNLTEAFKNVN